MPPPEFADVKMIQILRKHAVRGVRLHIDTVTLPPCMKSLT